MIFSLVHVSGFSYLDCESMSTYELQWFYEKLVEFKTAEKEAYENPGGASNNAAEIDEDLRRENEERLRRINGFRDSELDSDNFDNLY